MDAPCDSCCDEELRSIGVLSAVGHTQRASLMLDLEVLICELGAVDGLASSA